MVSAGALRIICLTATLFSLCAVTWTSGQKAESHELTISHVTVIDVRSGQLRPDQTIVIRSGKIEKIAASGKVTVPEGTENLDGSGEYAIPGLWDSHVHLSYLGACALPVFVAAGVTSVRDLGSRMEDVVAWRKLSARNQLLSPRIRTAGPNIESKDWLERAWQILPPDDKLWQLGPRLEISTPEQASAVIDQLVRMGVDCVKFRNLPRNLFLAVAAEAKRRGIPLTGHAPHATSLAEASRMGMKSIEHAETIMLALGHSTNKERSQIFRTLAGNGTLITPTLVTDISSHLIPDKDAMAIVQDSNNVLDPRRKYVSSETLRLWRLGIELKSKYGDAIDWHPQHQREVEDMRLAHLAGDRFLAGTDVGSIAGIYPGFSLHDELELMVQEVGLTPLEALQSATVNPPSFFGDYQRIGVIEPGSEADVVLLDANPLTDVRNLRRIRAVVIGGRVLLRSELDAELAKVARAIARGDECP